MSLLVMIFIGCVVLVLGLTMFWLTPATTAQPKLIKPIDTSIQNHKVNSSADQPRSRKDRPDTVDAREKLDR
jgi:hypothetical protein